jgi:hypothetical protein
MATAEAFFSLIQYVPDLDRAEGVNVGVVLLSPSGRAHVQLAETNELVRRHFPGHVFDDARLTYAKSSLERRLVSRVFESRDELERFGAALGNNLVLLPPRSTLLGSIPEELDSLTRALVYEPAAAPGRRRGASARRPLRRRRARRTAPRCARARRGRRPGGGWRWRAPPRSIRRA